MPLPAITMHGNLVRDPELRFTASGVPVAGMRVACSERVKQADGTWTDGATTFLEVTAWRGLAEVVAEQLRKGDRVTITGQLKQEDYEKDGQKRITYKVDATTVSRVLKPSTTSRDARPASTHEADPWATTFPEF